MMKARVSHLHKQETEWRKLDSWVPEAGELVVYDPDINYSYSRLKVGDGVRSLKELDFLIDSSALTLLKQRRYFEIIDAGRVTDFKK
jgi:hypothetical protein